MRCHKAVARTDGYFLVEALLASCAVAVGLAGVLVAFSVLTRTARLADERSRALHQARQQMEILTMNSYLAPALAVGTHSLSGGSYVVTAYAYPATKQITLSLDVVSPNNTTSQVSVATVMASVLHK